MKCPILTKFEFFCSQQKSTIENVTQFCPATRRYLQTDGQAERERRTDMTKLKGAFRDYAIAPRNV
jgi:hypothetical protein